MHDLAGVPDGEIGLLFNQTCGGKLGLHMLNLGRAQVMGFGSRSI